MKQNLWWYISIAGMWAAAGLNFWQAFRSLRRYRREYEIHQLIWAYEKELQERGVSLPPRCSYCCQILPKHVDGCHFARFYSEMDKVHELLTRPRIKYYPKGNLPPDTGGEA